MRKRSSVVGALMAVALFGAGLGMAQLGLRDDGIEFPDGTVQTTAAALEAVSAVQGEGSANIDPLAFCSGPNTLYTVPAGKRLAIEWIAVRIAAFTNAEPVEVGITTRSGVTPITHQLVRFNNATVIDGSFFWTEFWHSMVRLYSDAGQTVEISACRDIDADDTQLVTVTFSGHLVDVP